MLALFITIWSKIFLNIIFWKNGPYITQKCMLKSRLLETENWKWILILRYLKKYGDLCYEMQAILVSFFSYFFFFQNLKLRLTKGDSPVNIYCIVFKNTFLLLCFFVIQRAIVLKSVILGISTSNCYLKVPLSYISITKVILIG